MALFGVAGAGATAGRASGPLESNGERGRKRSRNGRRWNRDADGHSLDDLGSLDVDPLYTPARAADVVVWRDDGGVYHKAATLELRAKAFEGPDAAFVWESYFEWDPDGGRRDLVFEWRTDPGEELTLDYVVDRPRVNLDRRTFDDT